MITYKIRDGRHDVEDRWREFEFQNDEEAIEYFDKNYRNNPSYAWNYVDLYRVDQKQIIAQEEKKTRIAYRG